MLESNRERIRKIPFAAQIIRHLVVATYGKFIPFNINDIPLEGKIESGIVTARRFVSQGNGLIIAHTHADKGEPPRIATMLYSDEVMGMRHIIFPIGYHQVKEPQSFLARLLCSTNIPVVTAETQRFLRERNLPEIPREQASLMMSLYLEQAVDTLSNGGIVVVAPQGSRESYLGTLTSAISTLVNRLQRANIENYAVLFIGAEIPETDKVVSSESINHGVSYKLNIGRCFSIERLLAQANGKISQVDEAVRNELVPLVAPSYLKQQ